jgi:hypothetical protein
VFNTAGEQIGFIDDNNNVCGNDETVIATLNAEYVAEDDDQAATLLAATAAEYEATGTNLTQADAQEVDEVDDEDYDAEADLKQKYGVNLQHTLVFIDDEGNSTRENLTGTDLAQLKAEL